MGEERKTVDNCFSRTKSTKQREMKQGYALSTFRLCDLTGHVELKTVRPKATGVRIPLPAPKNKDIPCGCPLFFATVRGDELSFAKRNGEFAYRRHIANHEAQSIRGICVARRCRLKCIPKRNGFNKPCPEQHTPLQERILTPLCDSQSRRMGFAYPTRRSKSSLFRRRVWVSSSKTNTPLPSLSTNWNL